MAPLERLKALEAVERAARRLLKEGLRLSPVGLVVRRAKDRSDPHRELFMALEAISPLNPSSKEGLIHEDEDLMALQDNERPDGNPDGTSGEPDGREVEGPEIQ